MLGKTNFKSERHMSITEYNDKTNIFCDKNFYIARTCLIIEKKNPF